jgi:hypothetical protein
VVSAIVGTSITAEPLSTQAAMLGEWHSQLRRGDEAEELSNGSDGAYDPDWQPVPGT